MANMLWSHPYEMNGDGIAAGEGTDGKPAAPAPPVDPISPDFLHLLEARFCIAEEGQEVRQKASEGDGARVMLWLKKKKRGSRQKKKTIESLAFKAARRRDCKQARRETTPLLILLPREVRPAWQGPFNAPSEALAFLSSFLNVLRGRGTARRDGSGFL